MLFPQSEPQSLPHLDERRSAEAIKTGERAAPDLELGFVCSQMIVVTLLAFSSVQASRGNKQVDISSYPIAGTVVVVLFLATPLFLVIAGPFFWKRLVSAGTGFIVGVIGVLYVITPVF